MGLTQPHSGAWRVPFIRRCRLQVEGGVREAVSCNISAKGVYVAVDPVPEIGDRVRLIVPFGEGVAVLETEAVVAWRNTPHEPRVYELPAGCGLRFVQIPSAVRQRIRSLVKAYRRNVPGRASTTIARAAPRAARRGR